MIRKLTLLAAFAATMVSGTAFAQSGSLVLYTSQPNEDAQATVDAFEAKYPDVDVQWVRDGTTKVMAKLQAEFAAGAPQPDLLLIADSVTMEGLKRDDRLMPYAEADTTGYEAGLHDADGTYFSTKLITTGIVNNTRSQMTPASWQDLAKPEAKGQVTMPSPLTSGAALVHLAAITQNADLGWDYVEALAANGATAAGGNGGILKAVAGGEKAYGVIVDYLPIREAANGAPVNFVFPEEGVTAVTEPVAILKTAKNPEAAKAFVDFLLSEEGQKLAASQGYLPARDGVEGPAGFPARETIKLMPFDAAKALADEEANKQRFAEIFGG
ncbi:MAG: ABC transporter substrate-binding protein [Aurantimonas endophytica]|uniref:Iron(III) transport system substrate-binding protein n=1 Tax=Aurantimonas endophytica TaxID=1522175 RepID=A0A7W6HC45_9HYPH|nr:ABC transporter substrate-binding protein [Aurantimonas endophytica]MBB4002436.1 iron(III) transport system substrate-binding protein [Aurantimonas endophytica]MCO6401943.1 extracellular solute-binding protein [Aurantimonas endophytica]